MSDATSAATAEPAATATSALVPVPGAPLPSAERVALVEATPAIEDLFRFSREAELRFRSLRMVISEEALSARGTEARRHLVWLRHPGQASVTTYHDEAVPARDYDVWLLDGGTVTTYMAARNVASRRPLQRPVVGVDEPGMPPFARQRDSLTALPSGSLADSFVHPHGLFRNVLITGPLAVLGSRRVAGREAIIVRAQHPRASKVLVDRPDRSIEVGIDRLTGLLLLYSERIADEVTRHAEVSELTLDPVVPPMTFELRLPADVRMLY